MRCFGDNKSTDLRILIDHILPRTKKGPRRDQSVILNAYTVNDLNVKYGIWYLSDCQRGTNPTDSGGCIGLGAVILTKLNCEVLLSTPVDKTEIEHSSFHKCNIFCRAIAMGCAKLCRSCGCAHSLFINSI